MSEANPTTESAYWNSVADQWCGEHPQTLWRRHSDLLNQALLARWMPTGPIGLALKTDLFDEAVGEGLYPALAGRARQVVAVDLSHAVVAQARRRYPAANAAVVDVRGLPFASDRFDFVLSNSTLDHFDQDRDIGVSLREIHRILCPGGYLLLTMDNPGNPLVWLRNRLPGRWLRYVGLVPYKVGQTRNQRGLETLLTQVGLQVRQATTVMHCPRVLAVALAARVQRNGVNGVAPARLLGALQAFERLERLPTRNLTGHFVALLAQKPHANPCSKP